MSVDYIVSSLPQLSFSQQPPISWERFVEACGGAMERVGNMLDTRWRDLETELRNAAAMSRGSERSCRAALGCRLYWRARVASCFQEKDPMKRQTLLDRAWWDAAGELADPASPLGVGALAAYAVRLRLAIGRSRISQEEGMAAVDSAAAGVTQEGTR